LNYSKGSFSISTNPNYTITISDSVGREIVFRDITGLDLEPIESFINLSKESTDSTSYIVDILNLIGTQDIDFSRFSKRVLVIFFEVVNEHILCNFISKIEWLKICYIIQKGSFVNVHEMEKVPMSKFITMYEIHKELTESIPPDIE
jgi:hypothetical protein